MEMNNKKYTFIAIVLLVVVVVVVGFFVSRGGESSQEDTTPVNLITYRDPQLTDEEKQPFFDSIKQSEEKLASLPADSKAEIYQQWLNIAANYVPLGEYAKSLEAYKKASDAVPGEELAYYGAATVEEKMQDYASAKRDVKKALEIRPDNTDYWRFYITLSQERLGATPEEMEQLFAESLIATRDHINMVTIYAKYLAEQKEYVKAIEQWRRAQELNPDGAEIYESEITDIKNQL